MNKLSSYSKRFKREHFNASKGILNYKVICLIFLAIIWAVTCISKLKFNGLYLDFDYGIYQPDGVHYTYRTLTFLGYTPLEAAQSVSSWYQDHSFKMRDIDPTAILPENNGAWNLTQTRILYSVLSVPFVYIFGIPGMLAIPALSLLMIMLIPAFLKHDKEIFFMSCLIVFLVSISPTVQRWMLVNCTDSLLAGLFGAYLAVTLNRKKHLYVLVILDLLFIVLTSFTRFSLPFWLGIGTVLILERKWLRAAVVIVFSVICALPTIYAGGNSAFLPAEENVTLIQKIFLLPQNFGRILFYEVAQLAALDRGLLMLLAAALFFAVTTLHKSESKIFISFLAAGLLVGAINGTVGVNFRYQLPLLGPLIFLLANSHTSIKLLVSRFK